MSPGLPEPAATAPAFLQCIVELARAETNPVLLLLEGVTRLERERRYPEGGLSLMDGHWRCFYHCHAAPEKPEEEHGHFHFFAACETEDAPAWTHVAALSMDHEGQPLRWFTVNRWVTDGPWVAAPALRALLQWPDMGGEIALLQRWLSLVVRFYAPAISHLLEQRDRMLTEIKPEAAQRTILEDRQIYLLSARPVDVQADLVAALA